MTTVISYATEDGKSQIKLRSKDQTVWLTQREMAELFDVRTDNVGLHLNNIYEDGELTRKVTTEGTVFGRDAFLDRYEFSLPEIFGRAAKDAQRGCACMMSSWAICMQSVVKHSLTTRFATRCVANFIETSFVAVTEESSVTVKVVQAAQRGYHHG